MIRFENISKSYKNTMVLNDISFEINAGEIVVLIGPSGCGKTTTLKMINKLIQPSGGTIYIKEEDIAGQDPIALRRNIGYVIQQTGLFPHMTIKENIEIIPRLEKKSDEECDAISKNLLTMVSLDPEDFKNRYPVQLSGGQNQRVGVARAFATNPDIILMDEPFSAVDPITRQQLQDELVNLQAKVKKTIVFVTHDMDEAVKIADRICIMKDGSIVQYDIPENILKNPINEFVSNFVGKNRIWSNPEFIRAQDIMVTTPVTTFTEVPVLKVIENMRLRKVDTILVIGDDGKFKGVVSARSMVQCEDKSQPIRNLVKVPKVIAHPYDNIVELLTKVREHQSTSIPVVDENNLLKGLVTTSTLVTTLSQQYIDVEGIHHV
ncbi:betaine/proline/choline family ABC transporter ATP-binding protein [Tannockella kyphosi]|uniref:betaine/proline/choline family ABC transporter ATP-binding protein n=1 Tax=Tannockella kyphosi TaxID=2899121 RepID=UPI0020119261|nr:betaine/proline/choline family ABC transporter ATP-binding protein [Tannockella kyphosi]